mgnify:CR=1 FL=1
MRPRNAFRFHLEQTLHDEELLPGVGLGLGGEGGELTAAVLCPALGGSARDDDPVVVVLVVLDLE